MSPTKDTTSFAELPRSLDSPGDRYMHEVRIPILLDGESLLGESVDNGSLKVYLLLYSFEAQKEWDRLNTCITVKK
jgi:hypothetical protein